MEKSSDIKEEEALKNPTMVEKSRIFFERWNRKLKGRPHGGSDMRARFTVVTNPDMAVL